jgi:hypothetical protein
MRAGAAWRLLVLALPWLLHCGGGGGSGSTPAAPASALLPCPAVVQEHSQWCWAASGSSLLSCVKAPETQCAIVDYVRGITYACGNETFDWADTTANRAIEALYGPAPSVSDLMIHYGHPCTGQASALSFTEIQTEIGAGRPFFVNWAWASGGGHILLGMGWETGDGSQDVVLMDPWPNEGIKTVAYDWASQGSDAKEGPDAHTWRWTLRLDP